jgi:hypothetical protein
VEDIMLPLKRSVAVVGLGMAFLTVGAGAGHVAVAAPAAHPTVVTECNADPGYDSSQDPKPCHYQHPLPDTHWWRHHHY